MVVKMPRSTLGLQLPVSRVKIIMKSSPDVDSVGMEPLLLVTKVTELLVADLARRAYEHGNASCLDYKHLANLVKEDDKLDFLREIMPCKITVREYKELMAKKAAQKNDSDSDESNSNNEEKMSGDDVENRDK